MGTFLIDMDGVLVDFYGGVEKVLLENGIKPVKREEMTDYDFKVYPENVQRLIKRSWLEQGFYYNLEPVKEGIESLRKIEDLGHRAFICSAPAKSPYCYDEKMQWVERHIGKDFLEKTFLVEDKTAVDGDILLDDCPSIWGANVPSWEHVLYTQPWNLSLGDKKRRFKWSDGIEKLIGFLDSGL